VSKIEMPKLLGAPSMPWTGIIKPPPRQVVRLVLTNDEGQFLEFTAERVEQANLQTDVVKETLVVITGVRQIDGDTEPAWKSKLSGPLRDEDRPRRMITLDRDEVGEES